MIFHLHRETLVGGIDARPFRHCPAFHDTVELEAQVEVEIPRRVLLYHEPEGGLTGSFLAAGRLRRLREIALSSILGELFARGFRLRLACGHGVFFVTPSFAWRFSRGWR